MPLGPSSRAMRCAKARKRMFGACKSRKAFAAAQAGGSPCEDDRAALARQHHLGCLTAHQRATEAGHLPHPLPLHQRGGLPDVGGRPVHHLPHGGCSAWPVLKPAMFMLGGAFNSACRDSLTPRLEASGPGLCRPSVGCPALKFVILLPSPKCQPPSQHHRPGRRLCPCSSPAVGRWA